MQQKETGWDVVVQLKQELLNIRALLERNSTPVGERVLVGIERGLTLCDSLPSAREVSERRPPDQDFISQIVSNGCATSGQFTKALRHINSYYGVVFTVTQLETGIMQMVSAYRKEGQVEFKQGDLKNIFRQVTGNFRLSIQDITIMLRSSGVLEPINPKIGNAGSKLTQRFIEGITRATEQKNPPDSQPVD